MKKIIVLAVSLLILVSLSFSVHKCSEYKEMNNNNVVALTDSIQYYKTKTNEMYVSKTLLEGDISTLKIVNDSLYEALKSMKVKNPSDVIYIETVVDNGKNDTLWNIPQIPQDSLAESGFPMITREFSFTNQYRVLEGKVTLEDTILGLSIEKDKVMLDYTLAIEGNKVFVKSSNPYIEYKNIQGITIPSSSKKRMTSFTIGPSISYGYDFKNKMFTPYIGISATYGIDILNLKK